MTRILAFFSSQGETVPDLSAQFLDLSRAFLTREYLPKIDAALERLSPDDLWWQPNSASNSIGHLLLHLTGNLRQWVVSGLGGEPDVREREREFSPRNRPDARALLDGLAMAVADADAAIARLDPKSLSERRTVQGREVTGLEALYHAVEHFGMHTGQILYITKLRTGDDLGFYEVRNGVATARWPGSGRDG